MISNVSYSCIIIHITRSLYLWWSRSFLDCSKESYLEVNLCMWEFGASHYTYVEILGTIYDYVIWWELKLLLTISKSTVEFWVGCYMSAVTMRACMHAFTSQNGINAFGVKWLGVEVRWISPFNSTQCLYSWMILVIYPYMDEIYGMITHIFTCYPLEKYILMMWCHVKYYMRSMLKYLYSWHISTSFKFSRIEMWNLYIWMQLWL